MTEFETFFNNPTTFTMSKKEKKYSIHNYKSNYGSYTTIFFFIYNYIYNLKYKIIKRNLLQIRKHVTDFDIDKTNNKNKKNGI